MTSQSTRRQPEFDGVGGLLIARPGKLPVLVAIFTISLCIPLLINVGSVRLSVYRIVLLLLIFPALIRLLSGQAGRIMLPDICVLSICLWSSLSLVVVHGLAPMVETIGILNVETLGAYLIGRCYIRTPDAFRAVVRLLFGLTLIVLPFALIEAYTGRTLILEAFDKVGTVYPPAHMLPRWGLERVQGPFPHPIHFGVFFGSFVGLIYYVIGFTSSAFGKLWRVGITALTGALAFSSGPLTALMAQIYFILWDVVFHRLKWRWYLLAGLTVLGYVVVDMLSNRNPFQVFISYFAFNSETAYNRIFIWTYGTASIFKNPVWGIGMSDDWARPWWMHSSVDMFWILPAMRHGILVWILYFTLFFSIVIPLAFKKFGARLNAYRLGYLATMAGLFMAGWTVHYWDALFAYFMFMLSSGVWMLTYQETADRVELEADTAKGPARAYSRFPVTAHHPPPATGRDAPAERARAFAYGRPPAAEPAPSSPAKARQE